uniref:TIL domain-containing protein n=1 Tax=Ascaris lumbricoides TaxID=6252 RepID=A0A0M3IF92_ASCLU
MDCRAHERFVKCGPEPHCEMSCDNLYSPPHCHADYDHPKCYYPRCICNTGFVRDREGFCVREWKCPGRYFEIDDDDDNTEYQFKRHPREHRIKLQYKRHFW